jgi:signal transduction histidine kinase
VITLERDRLAALHEYCLLDAPAGDELEAVVRVAATVAGVPTATLNLIEPDGVGLSTCQRIVERRGGRIAASGTPGGGTTVTFSVPVSSAVPAGLR